MSPYRSLQVLAFAGFAGLPGLSVAGELTSMGHAATGPRLERHSVRSLTPDFNALVTPGRTYASLLARRITGTPGSSYRMVRNVGSVLKKAPENSYVLLGDFESGNIYAYQETAGLPLLATYSTGSSSGVGGIAEQEDPHKSDPLPSAGRSNSILGANYQERKTPDSFYARWYNAQQSWQRLLCVRTYDR